LYREKEAKSLSLVGEVFRVRGGVIIAFTNTL
jgi:hypothetical protein